MIILTYTCMPLFAGLYGIYKTFGMTKISRGYIFSRDVFWTESGHLWPEVPSLVLLSFNYRITSGKAACRYKWGRAYFEKCLYARDVKSVNFVPKFWKLREL